MKNTPHIMMFFCLILSSVFLQASDDVYQEKWKQVYSFENQGLTSSAQQLVQEIYQQAVADGKADQRIKALIHLAKYVQVLEENSVSGIVALFEKEIASTQAPEKNIVQSLLAEIYIQYYQQNMSVILDRSPVRTGAATGDITEWDLLTLSRETMHLLLESVQVSVENLQAASVFTYKELITETEKHAALLRPTMYDVLAHRAIRFLRNDALLYDPSGLKNPLTDSLVFSSASVFSKHHFALQDQVSAQGEVLRIYQELTRFHSLDPYPDAQIQLQLDRLNFGKEACIHPQSENLYEKALQALYLQYVQSNAAALVGYELAALYKNRGESWYAALPNNYRFYLKESLQVCRQISQSHPGSEGAKLCEQLATYLQRPELRLKAEQVQEPEQPFRILVSFRNTDTVWFKLVQVNGQDNLLQRKTPEEMVNYWLKKEVLTSWEQVMPDDQDDLQLHQVEIPVRALKAGTYVLLASTNSTFNPQTDNVYFEKISVSNLAYLQKPHQAGGYGIYVVNRNDGTAIPSASIICHSIEYDYTEQVYKEQNEYVYKTDQTGFAHINHITKGSLRFMLTHNGDTLHADERLYFSEHFDYPMTPSVNPYLYTDRAIYRPGQTIYFKCIQLQEEEGGKQKHASTNQQVHITFLDANFEPLATQTLTTNQFGSCSGSFYIPPGILPGTYTLMAANKSVSIQVEEYKRPSFEVESNPLTGSYKLGDTLGLSGYAKAYSGSPVANGKVTYRVVRVPVIPYYRYNGIMPGSIVETETDRGITVTDELGNFDIEFIVTGDEFRKEINSFIYNIYIDVMDNAGESHSHIATISVGTEALYLDCQIPDYAAQGDTLQLQTLVKNRTGVIQKTDVLLTVYPIEGGTEFHRERYWSTPDLFVLDKSTYAELFPLDAYANEDNLNTRAYGQALQRYVFLPDGKLNIPTNNWKPGIYRLVCAAKDAANNEVSETFILTIREPGKSPWRSEYLHSTTQYLTAEPGSSIILNAAATRGKGNALFSVYRDNKEIYSRWLSLSDTYLQIPLYITEADRGGLTAKLVMIADNRIHELTYYLSVPWSNKNLQVIIEQLRDKTEPGKNESCTIRILDQNQKPTQAELMVTLYDKSLEAYLPHGWWFPSYPNQNTSVSWRGGNLFTWSAFQSAGKVHYFQPPQPNTVLTDLRWFQFYLEGNERGFYALGMPFGAQEEGDATTRMEKREDVSTSLIEGAASTQEVLPSVRQDFRETAFFYPHLETDSSGSITFTFQMPESLTSWQLIGMAHTSDGKSGITYTEMTTSKELMITPYLPRYFKTGDTVVVSARIVNRGKQPQAGYARLQLSENGTENALHKSFGMADQPLAFSLAGGEQTVVRWTLHVPENIHQVTCTFQVSTETFTDGEQHTIPILSNRIFITESLPLSLRAGKEETHVFSSLKENTSRSLEHVQLSIEMSSRPVWYAVQALPYLVEQPYDGSEQIFNRFYAHALATYMVSSEKRLKNVFEQWRQSAEGLVSPLEKEAAWKQIQLEETPWVQEAIDETTRLQRVGLLFDTNQMEMSLKTSWRQLAQRQLPNGGFGWFGGMKEDVVVTQYILAGIGRLYKMKAMPVAITGNSTLIDQALFFADQTFLEHHKKKLQHGTDQKETPPTYIEIQYLYARSYFMHVPMMEELSALMPFYQQQVLQHWVHFDLQSQAMAALYLLRSGNETGANAIVNSLKETAIQSEETGMYWKKNKAGFRWQEAPIETQALLVELFSESGLEQEVQELRIWLLNQKLTQSWESSKATADACYALLMEGDNWLTDEAQVEIRVGGLAIQPTVAEAGTGYFRSQIAGTEVKPGMALIETDTRNLPKGSMAWGSVYWQYTEEESRVLAAAGEEQAFNIKQEIYRKKQTPEGIQLEPLTENNVIKLGDKIVIRLVIEARRDADYVHVKSSRSAGIEPTDALSGYTWQDGIGYYQATRDAATHFFFDHLPKGKYVIEYEAFASHAGHFSAGLAEIQCLYAPLFSHHSRGIRLTVE